VRDVASPLFARSPSVLDLSPSATSSATRSVLGEPDAIAIPTSSFDISSVLAAAGLTVDASGAHVLVSAVKGGDSGRAAKAGSAKKAAVVPSRAVGLRDLTASSSDDVFIGVAALIQLALVKAFDLSVFAFPSAPCNRACGRAARAPARRPPCRCRAVAE